MTALNAVAFAGSSARPLSLAGLIAFLAKARSVARERRQLRALDQTALMDLGISPAEARQEADRPFWEMPKRYQR